MFPQSELDAARHALKLARERCSLDATCREHAELRAALDAVGLALDGKNRTDALEAARRAQAIVDGLGTPPYTPRGVPPKPGATMPPGLRVQTGVATPQYVVTRLVRKVERLGS